MTTPPRPLWSAVLAVGIAALLLLGWGPSLAGPGLDDARKGTYIPVEAPRPGAREVEVGVYPVAVYDLDLEGNTFYADAYVWMRWRGAIDPTATIEFSNMVEEWGKQQELLQEEPSTLPDGMNYQIMRVEGRFVQPFSWADYPLDQHVLTIQIEDTTYGADQLAYRIDQQSSGVNQGLAIPGWKLAGWRADTLQHDYGTNFGETGQQPSVYSVARFEMVVRRPISFFLWKLLMPLLIVVVAALVALLLNPRAIDARLALPLGSLLSAIFLQKSYSDGLPDLGYLVFMDKIYLLAYPLILLVLVRVILSYRNSQDLSDRELLQMQRQDRQVMAALAGLFVLGAGLIALLR